MQWHSQHGAVESTKIGGPQLHAASQDLIEQCQPVESVQYFSIATGMAGSDMLTQASSIHIGSNIRVKFIRFAHPTASELRSFASVYSGR